MTVTVRFFAGLRERVGTGTRQIQLAEPQTAAQLWSSLVGEPVTSGVLVAINQRYADPDTTIDDGDEVAFFPPVTGG